MASTTTLLNISTCKCEIDLKIIASITRAVTKITKVNACFPDINSLIVDGDVAVKKIFPGRALNESPINLIGPSEAFYNKFINIVN